MDINELIDHIKHRPDYDKVGMILCHNGVVRGTSRDGRKVRGLRVAVDRNQLEKVIEEHKERPGIIEILVEINADRDLKVGDDVMLLVVAGDIRENVTTALSDALNAIKSTVTHKTEDFAEHHLPRGSFMNKLTHVDSQGRVRMVDVTEKSTTDRKARAQAVVTMAKETFELIQGQKVKKGNVLETARMAGVMAAKKTWDLIPMCHPLNLTHAQVDFFPDVHCHSIRIEATARILDQTGVEMEALTAASVAALTIYDMCKAYDRGMVISDVRLLEKSGGKSGTWRR
jgi:cyclic pyranopterin phosphate synthase